MLNVLLTGAGNIAGGFDADRPAGLPPLTHAGAYRAHGGFSLLACVEPDPARRAAFMARWKVPHGFASLGEATRAGLRFDVASLCSPTEAHPADLRAVLELGVRLVFCEKPLAPSVAAAQLMVEACRVRGVPLAVNHNRRWDPAVQRMGREIAAGDWGALRCATGHYNKGVLNNGTHLIDLMHLLLGPLTLTAVGRPEHDHWPADPSVPMMLEAQGRPVLVNCGHAADYSLFELQLVFERGVVAIEAGGLRWRTRRATPSSEFAGYTVLDDGLLVEGSYLACMSRAVDNLHRTLTGGASLASTGDSALMAQQLAAAALERALRSHLGSTA